MNGGFQATVCVSSRPAFGPGAAQKGRHLVKEVLEGPVMPMPRGDGSLWAEFALRPAALLGILSGMW
jgi:hypothetical protein